MLSWLVPGLCMAFMYRNLRGKDFGLLAESALMLPKEPLFIITLLLLPLNVSLEALKWKNLLGPVHHIGFMKALGAVLRGMALGLAAPHALGDFAGRSMRMGTISRYSAAGALALNNLSQYICVLGFGMPAWAYYLHRQFPYKPLLPILVLFIGMCFPIAAAILYFRAGRLAKILSSRYRKPYIEKFLQPAAGYSMGILVRVFSLGLTRYLIYSLQFGLMLHVCGVRTNFAALCGGIAAVWLAKATVPGLNLLGDLGLRELTALGWFAAFGVAGEPVAAAALWLWCINVLIPAGIGLLLLPKFRKII